MEEFENFNEDIDSVFSRTIKAGKRTYFIDVKQTKKNDFYLTITERKKKFNKDTGKFEIDKHRIFLYQEDFDKFIDGLNDAMNYISSKNTNEV
jgi:hypothetical protein